MVDLYYRDGVPDFSETFDGYDLFLLLESTSYLVTLNRGYVSLCLEDSTDDLYYSINGLYLRLLLELCYPIVELCDRCTVSFFSKISDGYYLFLPLEITLLATHDSSQMFLYLGHFMEDLYYPCTDDMYPKLVLELVCCFIADLSLRDGASSFSQVSDGRYLFLQLGSILGLVV